MMPAREEAIYLMPSGGVLTSSTCLHDAGEENWPLKLHLGCGGIFLRGYVNIDNSGVTVDAAPELVPQNMTTVSDYYARLDGDMAHLPARREIVCDLRCDITRLSYKVETVDKILAIQAFEHIQVYDVVKTLRQWHYMLMPGAPLVLSVPDLLGTLDMPIDQARRHLLGTTDNRHKAWYTRETLTELLERSGFTVKHLDNFHFYPAIVVRATKI
jgi:hypothetical protein